MSVLQGSCLSSLLCSLFLADLESSHLQDLLPRASRHPSAHPPPHTDPWQPHPGPTPTTSSAAQLTDLAQAADTHMQLSPSTCPSQQCLGTPSWDEVYPQEGDSSVEPAQEDQWLTQQVQSVQEATPLSDNRGALAKVQSAAAQLVGAHSAATQSAGSHGAAQSAAAQSADKRGAAQSADRRGAAQSADRRGPAQSADRHGAAQRVQAASNAPSQSPVNTDLFPDRADHRLNMKRPKTSQPSQQPAQAGEEAQQQATSSTPNRLDGLQQGSRMCAEGHQQASGQEQRWPEGHEDQRHPAEVETEV